MAEYDIVHCNVVSNYVWISVFSCQKGIFSFIFTNIKTDYFVIFKFSLWDVNIFSVTHAGFNSVSCKT